MDVFENFFPPRTAPTPEQIDKNVQAVLDLQHRAMIEHDRVPFASILVGPDHETILLSHWNVSHIDHAESCLARLASLQYSQKYLWTCSFYSTWELCAMCTGTAYWANIGRIVFAASNDQLMEITGKGNSENFTAEASCAEIARNGQKDIEVIGPIAGWDRKVMEDADWFWSKKLAQ